MKLKIVAPLHYFYDHPRDRLPEEIDLENGFSIKMFDTSLIDIVVNCFKDLYSNHEIDDLKNCRYCAVYEHDESSQEKINTARMKIHRLIESLRVVRSTRVACNILIFHVKENGDLEPQSASQQSNTIYLVSPTPGETHYLNADAPKISKYYQSVEDLYSRFGGKYNRVLNAFIFFQLGYLTHYAKLRVVPFATALESLFNTSEQEISYSLRLRCAAFLGSNQLEKRQLILKIKEIYGMRSAVVHGSSLPNRLSRNPDVANRILKGAEEISRRCFQKIFDEDLIEMYSQKNEELSKDLDGLIV